MEKTEQQQINDKIGECLEDLSESMEMSAKNRDLIMRLIEFGDTRIDSLENKIDILMTERAETTTQTKEDDVWYNQESKKAILDDIADITITPRALIELGFDEMYQDVDYGEPGYIFYSRTINGIDFLSMDTEAEDFYVIVGEDFKVKNLGKLRNFIITLKELV
jgi:hypothetical protein